MRKWIIKEQICYLIVKNEQKVIDYQLIPIDRRIIEQFKNKQKRTVSIWNANQRDLEPLKDSKNIKRDEM